MKSPATPPRLWCTAARDAPIAAVIARLPSPSRWTCILRWDLKSGRLESGAWTTLRFKDRTCRLSPDGRFFLYFASGPLHGPFRADTGGGAAISRLPWLAALTDIRPGCIAGGGPSRHALETDSQARLWTIFSEARWYFRTEDWPAHYGDAWQRIDERPYATQLASPGASGRGLRVAACDIPGRGLRLILVSAKDYLNDSSGRRQRIFLESKRDSGVCRLLPDVYWAQPRASGTILASTITGRLQELKLKDRGNANTPIKLLQDHDLTRLRHTPAPAPAWATAPLGSPRRRLPE